MYTAGQYLAELFSELEQIVNVGVSTAAVDDYIDNFIVKHGMVSETKGYAGYRHASCISVNNELVHGVPQRTKYVMTNDLVKIDVCASWKGYCADMARPFFVGDIQQTSDLFRAFINAGKRIFDQAIVYAVPGQKLFNISATIEKGLLEARYGIVKDFVGHGIGRSMHEDPEVPNFGTFNTGVKLVEGMAFAIEPMYTLGTGEVLVMSDGWTVKSIDDTLAMHYEDTVIIQPNGPLITTRICDL